MEVLVEPSKLGTKTFEQLVVMEVDTGASLIVLSEKILEEIKANCESLKLEPTKIMFHIFTGEIVYSSGRNESQCSI